MFIFVIDVLVRSFGLGWRSFRANGWNLFDMVVATGSFVTTFIVRFGASGYEVQQLQKLFLVSIAFKLVQRTNSLNMLFKTAVYVLCHSFFTYPIDVWICSIVRVCLSSSVFWGFGSSSSFSLLFSTWRFSASRSGVVVKRLQQTTHHLALRWLC